MIGAMARLTSVPLRWARDNAGAVALVFAAALAYSVLSVARHETYRSTGFDLGLFDQVVWHLSNLEAPASSLKGLDSIFGDHFSPILLAFAPLYWIWADPNVLLVAQAVLISAAALPIYSFAKSRLGRGPSLAIAGAYLLAGGVQSAIWFDLHEVAFAPLFIALAVLLADRERWVPATVAACALLLVKEDLSFLVVTFGLYFAILGRRRLGLGVGLIGFAWYGLITSEVIPHFADGVTYSYWSYTQLGPDAHHALINVIKAPWRVADVGLSPSVKLRTTAYLFGSFAGLTLLSPVVILALPLLAERMLSTNANYWTLHAHYSLTITPVLALGAAQGLERLIAWAPQLRERPARAATVVAGGMAVLAIGLIAAFPLQNLMSPSHYHAAPAYRAATDALKLIPDHASVAASNHLIPQLAHRDDVQLLGPRAPATDYVIAATADDSNAGVFPNQDVAALRRLLDSARQSYDTVFERGGVIVMHRR